MSELKFYVHDDMDTLRKYSKVPMVFFNYADCYIMQEDRIVFIDKKSVAFAWLLQNTGKRKETCYPYQTDKEIQNDTSV